VSSSEEEKREEPQINADDADQDRKSFDRIYRMNKRIDFDPV
jgi:hypothetical protein